MEYELRKLGKRHMQSLGKYLGECWKKSLAKSLVFASSLTISGMASAHWFECVNPFIGVDFYQAWMRPKPDFNHFFPKNFPGVTIYLGAKFSNYMGVELGYDVSARQTRSVRDIESNRFNIRITRTGGHFDLIGYMPLDCYDCFEFFGSIGYGWIQPQVSFYFNGHSLSENNNRGNGVLRLGLGTSYMFTECLGIRAKIGYEGTSSLRYNTRFIHSSRPYRDSLTFAAGFFARF